MAAEPVVLDLIGLDAAVQMIAAALNVTHTRAAALLTMSGIPTQRIDERVRVHRTDVTAYARHLAQQTRQVPVGGGPAIGYEAERDYRDGQDDRD